MKLPMNDIANSHELEKAMKKATKKLQGAGYTDPLQAEKIISEMKIPSFLDLTSIDRIWSEKSNIQGDDTNSNNQVDRVWELLKESNTEFISVSVRNKQEPDLKEVCLHPMDILYHIFRNASSEVTRILVENLDKMKIAFPIVLPGYFDTQKSHYRLPRLQIWPLQSIRRQTIKSKFNNYLDEHPIVACVRLTDSNELPSKFSIHSKSDLLNQIFFSGQHRFISRNHPGLAKKSGIKSMKRIHEGAIESTIFVPNIDSANRELDRLFEIWNLSGNMTYHGFKPQIQMIKNVASSIIVFLDNDENLEAKKKQISDAFGRNSNIVLLILDHTESDSSSIDSDEEEKFSSLTDIESIYFEASHRNFSFQAIRKFVGKHLHTNSNFSYMGLIEEKRPIFGKEFLNEFEIDMDNDLIKRSRFMVNDMFHKLEKVIPKYPDEKLQEVIFPIYFSISPLDKTMKIVEHIEYLKDKRVKLFNIHQRAEFEQDNEIDEDIKSLRFKQTQIVDRSEFVHIYLQHMQKIGNDKGKYAISMPIFLLMVESFTHDILLRTNYVSEKF